MVFSFKVDGKLEKPSMPVLWLGAVFMELSKAFECIPHDLLITNPHTYGFQKKWSLELIQT